MRATLWCLTLLWASVPNACADDIHEAARKGDVAKVTELLAGNPRLIAARNDMSTPLHIAAHRNQLAVVQLLLEKGADVNAIGTNESTPMHLASDPEIVKALLRHKPNLELRDSCCCQTPLEHAAEQATWLASRAESEKMSSEQKRRFTEKATQYRKIVALMLEAGAFYDIHTAIYLNDIDRVRALLKSDPTLVTDTHGAQELPLRRAAAQGHVEICRLLLEHKADPNDLKGGGFPVLVSAIGHPDVVKLLLQSGATPDMKVNFRGFKSGFWIIGDNATYLHFAAGGGDIESAKLLLEKGLQINTVDDEGNTPLHMASTFGQGEMVRFLLDRGADIHAKTKRGHTPLEVADSFGPDKGAAEVLRQRMERR